MAHPRGQAWPRPFALVYESSATDAPRSVKATSGFQARGADEFVGPNVETTNGRQDYVSSPVPARAWPPTTT
ncbi:MAG TPA: hypothetical protein VF629_03745 [Hymenobacter sp.]|uniref:hypothetical protein n=1 Tax=Hymenobacter sp. TaxID=1898978 RepID=UPI002ED8A5A9